MRTVNVSEEFLRHLFIAGAEYRLPTGRVFQVVNGLQGEERLRLAGLKHVLGEARVELLFEDEKGWRGEDVVLLKDVTKEREAVASTPGPESGTV